MSVGLVLVNEFKIMKERSLLIQVIIRIGLVLVLLRSMVQTYFALQFGGEKLFTGREMSFIEMGVTIAVMIYAGYHFREKNGNLISIQEGFLSMLGVYAVGSLGAIFFHLFYINVIDPSLLEMVPSSDFYSVSNVFAHFFTSLVMGSILALIFAFILSKRKAKIS